VVRESKAGSINNLNDPSPSMTAVMRESEAHHWVSCSAVRFSVATRTPSLPNPPLSLIVLYIQNNIV
jgi:hypothetical protein